MQRNTSVGNEIPTLAIMVKLVDTAALGAVLFEVWVRLLVMARYFSMVNIEFVKYLFGL